VEYARLFTEIFQKYLGKKRIMIKFKAMTSLKTNSERVPQVMFQKWERDVTKLIQSNRITEMSIISNYLSSEKKCEIFIEEEVWKKTGIILWN
jgi:hypothetical protein